MTIDCNISKGISLLLTFISYDSISCVKLFASKIISPWVVLTRSFSTSWFSTDGFSTSGVSTGGDSTGNINIRTENH